MYFFNFPEVYILLCVFWIYSLGIFLSSLELKWFRWKLETLLKSYIILENIGTVIFKNN